MIPGSRELREGRGTPSAVKISVVIPTWNARGLLHLPLDSLRSQTHRDFEAIVVDDASTDDTAAYLAAEYPEVRVVRLDSNRGFPGAVNAGIRAATGEVVALLNNDAAADEAWLATLDAALRRHPEAGMAACRIRVYHHREYLDSAGIYATTSGSVGNRGAYGLDGPAWDREEWVLGPNGAAGAYRKAVFDDVGLFDEDHGAYHEDTDLALRAQLRGHRCVYVPGAVCYHVGSATYSTLPMDAAGEGVDLAPRTQPKPPPPSARVMFFAAQNYPAILLKFVPWRVLLADSWAIAAYEANMVLFSLRHRHFRAYLRGRLSFLRSLPATLRKRRRIASARRLDEEQVTALFERPTLGQYAGILLRRLGRGPRRTPPPRESL